MGATLVRKLPSTLPSIARILRGFTTIPPPTPTLYFQLQIFDFVYANILTLDPFCHSTPASECRMLIGTTVRTFLPSQAVPHAFHISGPNPFFAFSLANLSPWTNLWPGYLQNSLNTGRP